MKLVKITKISAMALALGALTAGVAYAGASRANGVSITGQVTTPDGNVYTSTAIGSVVGTRNAADSVQFIGCKTNAIAGSATTATCTARNSAGAQVTCTTSDTRLVAIAQSVNIISTIEIGVGANGACKRLSVDNSSYSY